MRTTGLLLLFLVSITSPAVAEVITRTDWVPSAFSPGSDTFSGDHVGDLWTFRCPAGVTHSIQIYANTQELVSSPFCGRGGGYVLQIEVFDAHGTPMTEAAVGLGGGPLRTLQPWMINQGAVKRGPLIDNGKLPM